MLDIYIKGHVVQRKNWLTRCQDNVTGRYVSALWHFTETGSTIFLVFIIPFVTSNHRHDMTCNVLLKGTLKPNANKKWWYTVCKNLKRKWWLNHTLPNPHFQPLNNKFSRRKDKKNISVSWLIIFGHLQYSLIRFVYFFGNCVYIGFDICSFFSTISQILLTSSIFRCCWFNKLRDSFEVKLRQGIASAQYAKSNTPWKMHYIYIFINIQIYSQANTVNSNLCV